MNLNSQSLQSCKSWKMKTAHVLCWHLRHTNALHVLIDFNFVHHSTATDHHTQVSKTSRSFRHVAEFKGPKRRFKGAMSLVDEHNKAIRQWVEKHGQEPTYTMDEPPKCPHGTFSWNCKPCGGSGVCIHGLNSRCRFGCGWVNPCVHGKERWRNCLLCKPLGGGKEFCGHDKRKQNCRQCPENVCPHNKHKYRDCKICKEARAAVRAAYREACRAKETADAKAAADAAAADAAADADEPMS